MSARVALSSRSSPSLLVAFPPTVTVTVTVFTPTKREKGRSEGRESGELRKHNAGNSPGRVGRREGGLRFRGAQGFSPLEKAVMQENK